MTSAQSYPRRLFEAPRTWESRYPAERQQYDFSRLQSYEQAKSIWIAEHPAATPQEYQAAMNRLCKECGV